MSSDDTAMDMSSRPTTVEDRPPKVITVPVECFAEIVEVSSDDTAMDMSSRPTTVDDRPPKVITVPVECFAEIVEVSSDDTAMDMSSRPTTVDDRPPKVIIVPVECFAEIVEVSSDDTAMDMLSRPTTVDDRPPKVITVPDEYFDEIVEVSSDDTAMDMLSRPTTVDDRPPKVIPLPDLCFDEIVEVSSDDTAMDMLSRPTTVDDRPPKVFTVPDEYFDDSFEMLSDCTVFKTITVPQVLATFFMAMGTMSSGLSKGFIATTLDAILRKSKQQSTNSWLQNFFITQQQASWIASFTMLGATIGAVNGHWLMSRGRRLSMRITSVLLILMWVFTSIATMVEEIYIASFFGGCCCAFITMVAQVYISEIATPSIRGCLSGMLKVAGHVGALLSYTVGMYVNWRISALFWAVPPCLLFLGSFILPETPSFLLLYGQESEAACSLQWFRGTHAYIRRELLVIKANILVSRRRISELTFRNIISTPRLYKPIAITCGMMFFLRFSGANTFNYYAVIIFRQTMSGMNPHGAAIVIVLVQLIGSLLSGFVIDIVGRIPLLMSSMVFMLMALVIFASCTDSINLTLNQKLEYQDISQNDWILLFCVVVFMTAMAMGISPISWLLTAELFPLEYRALGLSISTTFSYFCAFLGIKFFMDFQQMLGMQGTFWVYAMVAALGLCFVANCVPETKFKQLDEMNPYYAQAQAEASLTGRL